MRERRMLALCCYLAGSLLFVAGTLLLLLEELRK